MVFSKNLGRKEGIALFVVSGYHIEIIIHSLRSSSSGMLNFNEGNR